MKNNVLGDSFVESRLVIGESVDSFIFGVFVEFVKGYETLQACNWSTS